MRRGVVHVAGWTLATGAMIGLSWYGVRSVMDSAVPEEPHSLSVAGSLPADDSVPSPVTEPSTPSASPSVSASATPSPSATHSATGTPSAPKTSARPPQHPPGGSFPGQPTISPGRHTYTVDGGKVVLDIGPSSATFVSATPNPGWSAKWWQETGWIRVQFTSGDNRASAVFCSWNGHPPVVQTYST